jgi:hypothetical protein
VPEQLRQPLDNRKSEPESLAPVALGIPELREFLENLGVLLGGYARSRMKARPVVTCSTLRQ